MGSDVTLFKNQETDEVIEIGILDFKTKSLNEIELKLPFKVNFSALKV